MRYAIMKINFNGTSEYVYLTDDLAQALEVYNAEYEKAKGSVHVILKDTATMQRVRG